MLSRIILFLILLTLGLHAIEGAVSVSIVDKERYFISEEVLVNVNLKSTAFSIKDAKIGLVNSDDYIIQAPQSASFLQTVDINGTDWQIVYYEYKLYPLHAGKMEIPKIEISFSASMGYGQSEDNFTFLSDALSMNILAPEGVSEEDFVLSTPNYVLKSVISPKLSEANTTKIKVGDVIELQITQEAKNVLDLLLKPIVFTKDSHLKIYKEEPILKSKTVGSDTIATRTDAFTFVASNEGNVSIPSQKLVWWDPVKQVLHTEETGEWHFMILPNPKSALDRTVSDEDKQIKLWILMILLVILSMGILYKMIPYIKRKRADKKRLYIKSEEGRFKALLESCQSANMATLYHALYYWLEVADPKLSKAGFKGISKVQPSLHGPLLEVEKGLVDPQQIFDKTHFIKEVKIFRQVLLKQEKIRHESLPKNINPNL